MLKYNSWQLNRILFSRRLDSEAHMYNKAALAADFNGKLASFIHTHVHIYLGENSSHIGCFVHLHTYKKHNYNQNHNSNLLCFEIRS